MIIETCSLEQITELRLATVLTLEEGEYRYGWSGNVACLACELCHPHGVCMGNTIPEQCGVASELVLDLIPCSCCNDPVTPDEAERCVCGSIACAACTRFNRDGSPVCVDCVIASKQWWRS